MTRARAMANKQGVTLASSTITDWNGRRKCFLYFFYQDICNVWPNLACHESK